MKKFCYLITAVLFAVAVCAAVLCVGLNIPAFYEATVPTIVYWTCPGAELKGFAVKTARFRFPDRIELGGVEVAFKQDGHSHHIVMDKVTNQGLVEYLGGSGRVAVDVMIRSYLSEQFSGQNVIFNTLLTRNNAGETVTRTTGIVGTLSTADYHLQGVHYQVNGGHPVYDIKIKEGKFYGGQFKADIQLKAAGRMPYSGTIVLQDIPTGELNEAFPDLEKDFQGVFSGDIYLVGDRNKLLTLEANLISQQDMLVRSTLVGWIIQYN